MQTEVLEYREEALAGHWHGEAYKLEAAEFCGGKWRSKANLAYSKA